MRDKNENVRISTANQISLSLMEHFFVEGVRTHFLVLNLRGVRERRKYAPCAANLLPRGKGFLERCETFDYPRRMVQSFVRRWMCV